MTDVLPVPDDIKKKPVNVKKKKMTAMSVEKTVLPVGRKKVKIADKDGLYLLINKSGKYWRHDYKINGKRKEFSIGTYPKTSLAEARDTLVDIKRLIKKGVDPNIYKREQREKERYEQLARIDKEKATLVEDKNTFETVARRWHKVRQNKWSDRHAATIIHRLDMHVFPSIGKVPVLQLNKIMVADVLAPIADRGTTEIAHRVAGYVRNVLEYAVDFELIEYIPMAKTSNILPPHKSTPMKAITDPVMIGDFLRASYEYRGTYVVRMALKLLPLLACRTGEFRLSYWTEFNLDNAVWTIPAAHRKLKKAQKEDANNIHYVPLSIQAVVLLRELQGFTGRGNHVFPSSRGDSRPMSENTVNSAIKNIGFGDVMVGHGVRSMFSTAMNPKGFNPDAIERQLAHKEKDTVRDAYNRAKYLEERTRIMQAWADYLDGLREIPSQINDKVKSIE